MNGGSGVMKGRKRDSQDSQKKPDKVIILDPISLVSKTANIGFDGLPLISSDDVGEKRD